MAVAVMIDGDERQVGGGDMTQLLLADIFDHRFDADFHRGAEGAVDAGFEDEEIADVDGGDEVEVIHGGGDDERARVPTGGHGANEIHKLHQAATKEVAQGVRVGGEDDLAAL